MPTVNEQMLDAAVERAVLLQLFGNRTTREVTQILREAEPAILRVVSRVGQRSEMSLSEVRRILGRISVVIDDSYRKVERRLNQVSRELTRAEADWINRLFAASLSGITASVAIDASKAYETSKNLPFNGRTLVQWVRSLKVTQAERIVAAVVTGYLDGDTNSQIIQRVRGRRALKYTDGIIQTGYRQASAIVRTVINQTANRTYQRYYEANDTLVKQVQWRSTLDGRTSPICRARDNQVYALDKGPRPPAHPGCRSVMAPVLNSAQQLGIKDLPESTRASMDGQVPGDLRYGDWLRGKSRSFVETVLGRKKAKLFLDGGLPMDRFVNPNGRELTLDQLFQLQPDAFRRAGITP